MAGGNVIESARWEHFAHDADMGVRGIGDSLASALEQVALALTAVLTDPAHVKPLEQVSIECRAHDPELLLYDWLNELVYQMATRRMLFGHFDVRVEGGHLTAVAHGEPVDRIRHGPAVEIKGATMTELEVNERDGVWTAQCVVDV